MPKRWFVYFGLLFQFVFIGYLIWQNESIKQNGKVLRFLIEMPEREYEEGFKFQSRLVFQQEKVAAGGFKPEWRQMFYLQVGEDKNGFSQALSASAKCSGGNCLKVQQFGLVQDSATGYTIHFRYGFDDYYWHEGLTEKVNRALRKALSDPKSKVWMEVRIKDCKAIPTGIFVNGKPLQF